MAYDSRNPQFGHDFASSRMLALAVGGLVYGPFAWNIGTEMLMGKRCGPGRRAGGGSD